MALLYSRRETRSGGRHSSGERPGLEDYYLPGGKLGPEDDIVLERGLEDYYIPGEKLGPEDDIVPERGPVQRIIIFPDGNSVQRIGYPRRESLVRRGRHFRRKAQYKSYRRQSRISPWTQNVPKNVDDYFKNLLWIILILNEMPRGLHV